MLRPTGSWAVRHRRRTAALRYLRLAAGLAIVVGGWTVQIVDWLRHAN